MMLSLAQSNQPQTPTVAVRRSTVRTVERIWVTCLLAKGMTQSYPSLCEFFIHGLWTRRDSRSYYQTGDAWLEDASMCRAAFQQIRGVLDIKLNSVVANVPFLPMSRWVSVRQDILKLLSMTHDCYHYLQDRWEIFFRLITLHRHRRPRQWYWRDIYVSYLLSQWWTTTDCPVFDSWVRTEKNPSTTSDYHPSQTIGQISNSRGLPSKLLCTKSDQTMSNRHRSLKLPSWGKLGLIVERWKQCWWLKFSIVRIFDPLAFEEHLPIH